MRRIPYAFIAALLAAALFVGCKSKQPATAATDDHPDGVSSVPAPADRDPDVAATDLPIAGAVKEVKFKVLDKEGDDKTKGLMRLKVFSQEGTVDLVDNSRWEVWKPGSDPEEQRPEMSSSSSSESAVPPGTWDVRVLYDEGDNCKVNGWIRNVNLEAGKLWKGEVLIAAPMQYVRLFATLNGDDLADHAHIDVFKAGADQEEFRPIAGFWSTQKLALVAGNYDFRFTYEKDKLKAKGDLKGFAVGTNHGVLKRTVALAKIK